MTSLNIDGSQTRRNESDVDNLNAHVPHAHATPAMSTISSQNHPVRRYPGGFSTSICQFFEDPRRKNDCCALACLGVLSWDRTNHLMYRLQQQEGREQGINSTAPESLFRQWASRLGIVVGLPMLLTILFILLFSAETVEDTRKTILWMYFFSLMCLIHFLAMRWRGARRVARMNLIHELNLREQDGNTGTTNNVHQDRYDASKSHSCCCGIYGSISRDPEVMFSADSNQQEYVNRSDLCTNIWNFAKASCCGLCCQSWLQCCGMCAIGQEEREINRMVPRAEQMIDYVTFQPYIEYFSSIEKLRRDNVTTLEAHIKAISDLSRILIKVLLFSTGIFICLCFLGALYNHDFGLAFGRVGLFLATFGQAFLVLYFVHWHWHRLDLSFDAVVKYFGCGFLISVSFAAIYEVLVQVIFIVFYVIIIELEMMSDGTAQKFANVKTKEQFTKIGKDFLKGHPELLVLYAFVNAFVVAAFVEEISKYFGFWMVEHPDFVPHDELEEQDNYIKSKRQEDGLTTHASHSTNFLGHKRNLIQVGAGITIAMVAVATGFACCENLMYIFSYTNSGLASEWLTLAMRSVFPIHPLCAAIQSIGVCRRELQKDESMKLGKVIFPALLLHGTFDFVLMIFAAFDSINQAGEEEEHPLDFDDLAADLAALGICLGVMIVSIFYYVKASRKQKVRLDQEDLQNSFEIDHKALIT